MSDQLRKLLTELGQNSNLETKYQQDPESVMSEYGLADDDKQLLRDEDSDGIRSKLQLDSDPHKTNKIIGLP